MDQSTLDKLRKLHLKTMAAAYETQDSVPGIMDMTFDERLSFLVDAEMDSRDNRRLSRRIKEAHFRTRRVPDCRKRSLRVPAGYTDPAP